MELTPDIVVNAMAWYVVFVFSTCLHEAGHAWAALRLGDPTAYHGGQVTLNPIPHMQREPLGMIVVPIIALLTRGWAFGWASAPYDPNWAMTWPKRAALMALAGPAGNLLIAAAAAILLRAGLQFGWFAPPGAGLSLDALVAGTDGGVSQGVAKILSIFLSLNLILFLFNLLPLPPLDGSAAVMLAMDDPTARRYYEFIHRPGLWLIGMIVAWNFFPRIFYPAFGFVLRLLYSGLGGEP